MPKEEWGVKRICPTTGKRFYDLNKTPIVSPYTGETVVLDGPKTRVLASEKTAAKQTAGADDDAEEDVVLDDDDTDTTAASQNQAIWLRGLAMLIFAVLLYIAIWVLMAATLLQFLWMLFAGERNRPIADFGDSLSKWLAATARFQSGASEDKPFPWSAWGR